MFGGSTAVSNTVSNNLVGNLNFLGRYPGSFMVYNFFLPIIAGKIIIN